MRLCAKRVAAVAALALLAREVWPKGPPAPVPAAGEAAVAAEVDALLEAAWRRRGVQPAAPVDDTLFYRRLAIDLHGTIPSLPEIRAFEAEEAEARRERLIQRAVSDERFADRLAEELAAWFCGDEPRPGLDPTFRERRFRLWLRDQVAAGRPYDALVREMMAAEGLPTAAPATSFVTGNHRDADRLAARTARVFLGLQIGCAQCHDHPFATWRQQDFKGLAAFYARVEKGPSRKLGGEIGIHEGGPRDAPAGVPFDAEGLPRDLARERPREALAAWVTASPRFARATVARLWRFMLHRGLTRPFDDLDQGEAADEALAAALDRLARDFRENGHDLGRAIRVIARTRAYALGVASAPGADRAAAADLFAVYEPSPLRSRVLAFAVVQATSLTTVSGAGAPVARLQRFGLWSELVARFGDPAETDALDRDTVPRVLKLMNAEAIDGGDTDGRLRADLLGAVGRVNALAPTDRARVEALWLMALARRPDGEERERFEGRLSAAARAAEGAGEDPREARARALADVAWSLVNSTEFQTQH